ncbi:MAG TPA: YggT family protein [Candidatus Krumholzibacteria bacterium]|nr:YggT family protein [Candidatus Krumholzibacteria bacterium]
MQIANLLTTLLDLYMLVLLARVLLSWVSLGRQHPVSVWVYRATEPLLAPIRSVFGIWGGLDFSPVVAILILSFLRRLIVRILL